MSDNTPKIEVTVHGVNSNEELDIPKAPPTGAKVKVCYAGAYYSDVTEGHERRHHGYQGGTKTHSASTGLEVSGVIDSLGSGVENSNWQLGDRVIIYPDSGEDYMKEKYDKFIIVNNKANLVQVPNNLRLDIASLLPTGGLKTYSAMIRAKPLILDKINNRQETTNVLIVGAGGLGLWTLKMAEHLLDVDPCKLKLVIADTSIEKLMLAEKYGCFDVVHWHEALHEELILERTQNVCPEGVDVIIDFVCSPRTIKRALKLLNKEGVLLVHIDGTTKYDFSFNLAKLSQNEQSIMGVSRGSRQQLVELVDIIATGKVEPPTYSIFPVAEANAVLDKFTLCKINSRAVFEICPEEAPPASNDQPPSNAGNKMFLLGPPS